MCARFSSFSFFSCRGMVFGGVRGAGSPVGGARGRRRGTSMSMPRWWLVPPSLLPMLSTARRGTNATGFCDGNWGEPRDGCAAAMSTGSTFRKVGKRGWPGLLLGAARRGRRRGVGEGRGLRGAFFLLVPLPFFTPVCLGAVRVCSGLGRRPVAGCRTSPPAGRCPVCPTDQGEGGLGSARPAPGRHYCAVPSWSGPLG